MSSSSPESITSIGVIVGLDLVGDALIKLPFVRTIRATFPEASLHWVTSKGPTAYNGPLRNLTRHLIDEINEQPPWLDRDTRNAGYETLPTVRALNPAPHFDLLIDTRNSLKDAWRARKSIPHDLFIAPAACFIVSNRRPPLFDKRPPHLVDRLLQLIELTNGKPAAPLTERLPVSELLQLKARQLMPKGNVYVGLAPGAGNPVKIWPLKNFIEVAKAQTTQNRVPVFLLGPQEENCLPGIKESVPTALFPLQARKVWGTPNIEIEQTLAVGSHLAAAIANDSGTGHMLAAIDCPLVSLFGPTSPEKLAPRVTHGIVIRAQEFDKKANTMDVIKVDNVLKATNDLIMLQNQS